MKNKTDRVSTEDEEYVDSFITLIGYKTILLMKEFISANSSSGLKELFKIPLVPYDKWRKGFDLVLQTPQTRLEFFSIMDSVCGIGFAEETVRRIQ